MPTRPAKARAWLDAAEQADRKNARVIDKVMVALPLELDAAQREALIRVFIRRLSGDRVRGWRRSMTRGRTLTTRTPISSLETAKRRPDSGS